MSGRFSLSSRAELDKRKAYDRIFQAELRQLAKASGWTKYQCSLVRRDKEWFVAAVLWLLWPTRRVSFDVFVKPMALDPQLWRIMKINDFERFSLSHRQWGAFVCRVPALANCSIPLENPQADARRFIDFADAQWPRVISLFEDCSFADTIGFFNSYSSYSDAGRYTVSYLISLLNDGRYSDVAKYEVRRGEGGVTHRNLVSEEGEPRSEDVIDLIKAQAVTLSKTSH